MSALSETYTPAAPARLSSWRLLMSNRLAAFGFFLLALICVLIILVPILPLPNPAITQPGCDSTRKPATTGLLCRSSAGHRPAWTRYSEPPSLGRTRLGRGRLCSHADSRRCRLGYRHRRRLCRRAHRQPYDARHQYADGLPLYPVGSCNRCSAWTRIDECALCNCRGQYPVLCT